MLTDRFYLFVGVFFICLIGTFETKAQNPLTAISFTFVDVDNAANDYTATSASDAAQTIDGNVPYDIFFSRNTTANNNRVVSGYTLGGTSYSFLLDPDTLALRRLGSATRLSLWVEAELAVDNTADEIYLAPERQVPERSLYQANLLNIGYDNVLVNSGDNASNIERIDAIYRSGMLTSTPGNAIIPVMDRGHNGVFKIAMITSLDANGDPASYGDLIEVAASDFGGGVVTFNLSILFLQQALGEDPIPTGSSTQNLGGVGISFTELGIASNEIVYGYSLFSVDVNIIDHDLTDISTFPTDSNNSGLDMAAGAVSAVSSDGLLIEATGPGGYKATLNTWLKANEGITTATDNSPVTDWQDQSLGDHDATNLGTSPTYRDGSASVLEDINFNPTVDFIDATETGLQIANNSDFNVGGAPYTTKSFNIALRTGNNITTKQQIYEQGDDDRGIDMYIESGNLVVTAYNQIDDSGSGVSSPWNNGGSLSTISTSLSLETEYIVTFEFNGSASGTGTVTAYLNGQSFGNFGSVGQLADHSDQIGLGDFNSQTVTDCLVTSVVSSTGVVNPNNIIGAVNGTFAEVNTNGNIITVDFGTEYPAGTQYEITWRRRPASTGTAIMVLRESTSPASGFVDHPSPPQVSPATFETDVVTANSAFRYIQITKTNPPSSVDFQLDAIAVQCNTLSEGDAASFYGSIPEFIYCNEPGSFTTAQRNRIESYLAIKYGITLDQSTPINYVNSTGNIIFNTTNNASIGGYLEYNNDIAGIGRDDDSELDQSKSLSENTDAIVTIDRGATISTDDAWLIWGNDNGALTESSVLTMPDTIDSRLTRVWRVAEESEVLTTSVSFDITGLGLSTNQSQFSLLVAGNSSNADFSSATVISGGVLVGNTLTFSGVDLEDGQYFTLGTDFMTCSPGGVEDGLQLWLRADEGVTDNAGNITWTDQSILDNNAVQSGGTTTTGSTNVNFNNVIVANNLNRTFTTGSLTAQSIIYAGAANTAGNADFSGFLGVDGDVGIRQSSNGTNVFRNPGNADDWANSGAYYFNGLNNTTTDIDNVSTFHIGVAERTTTETADFYVGGYFTNRFYTGNTQYAEVIVYEDVLTAVERQRVESYLAVKYGITIDQTTPTNYVAADAGVTWDATINAAHNNDIAGIGRDDMSCLEQKQSISQNSDAIVTVGLGTIETDNSSNPNTFGSDDSFLVWGNDNASTTFAGRTTGVTGTGTVTERMTRTWRADENTDVGSTSISFDLTGLGYGTTLSDYQLIISDNSDLSSSTQYQAATISGNTVTFSGINLTDGQYFTLGTARTACGPGGVTGDLYVWLRADAGTSTTTDNTTLATWSDQSGTDTDGVTDGTPPLFKNNTTDNINFNPTIDFDGTDDRLTFGDLPNIKSGATNGGDYTLIGVGIRQDDQVNYILGSSGNTTNQDLHFGYRNNTQTTLAHWGNDLNLNVTGFDAPQAPYLISGEYDGAISILEETRGGAFSRATRANTTDLSGTKDVFIGERSGTINYNGLLSEIIIFDNDITDLQQLQVNTYLAIKYGITLTNNNDDDATANEIISGAVREGDYVASDGSTVIWTYADNTTYHNDVAGIGRDDDGCFTQKQSTAPDTDDILTVGLGSVATSNLANLNGFDDDKDFLLWGNDNGTTAQASANTADVPATIAERMARVWKVQDTGTVGETELQFDLTSLGYDVSNAAEFSLLVGNTATMADATIVKGGTLDGTVLSFTGIDLTDGQFFTIATKNTTCGPGGVNTDIAIWFRADEEVFSDAGTTLATDGQNVLQWNDQSSSANNASEENNGGGTPVEPTFETNEINFNPVIRFSDAQSDNNSWLETATNATTGSMTLISIFKTVQNRGTTNVRFAPALISSESNAGNNDYALSIAGGRAAIKGTGGTDNFSVRPATPLADNKARILTGTREQANNPTGINIYVNSENIGSATSNTTPLTNSPTFAMANHSDYEANGQYEGDIAENIVFDKVLTETEQARVESYLAIKYGITRSLIGLSEAAEDYLAADGGIIWDVDNQGVTYHNDMFGIGRDDLSCFEQIKSQSENSDALVTFDNGASFGTNDSFILSGNDNAVLEEIENKERPLGINSRLNREWRVQETGTVGSISLTYDLSTISGPLGVGTNNANLLRLMVDDDGDFSTGPTLISPTSIDGSANTVTFTVDFTDGQYYTLGSTEEDALPITLISFTANNEDNERIVLNWTTAQEVNNAFYTIERSTDAIEFEAIGFMDGAGNSDDLIDYIFTDTAPLTGQAFYRLKQTDRNGTFEYSELLSVFLEKPEQAASYKVFPNPVGAGKTLTIARLNASTDQGTFQYQVLSMNGLSIMSGSSKAKDSQVSLDTSSLSSGMYLLRITQAGRPAKVFRLLIH